MSLEKSQSRRPSTGIKVFCLKVHRNRSQLGMDTLAQNSVLGCQKVGDEASGTEKMYHISPSLRWHHYWIELLRDNARESALCSLFLKYVESGITPRLHMLLQVSQQISEALSSFPVQTQSSSHFKFSNRSTNEVYEPLTLGQFSKVSESILKHLITLLHWKQIVDQCN